MKKIIYILSIFFFISDCSADARVLAEIMSKAHKPKMSVAKIKKPKKFVKQKTIVKKIKRPNTVVDTKNNVVKDIKPKEIVITENLDIKNNVAYLPNNDTPFTGKHITRHPNGNKYIETNYTDGKRNGLLIMLDEKGYKIGQLNFINGIYEYN